VLATSIGIKTKKVLKITTLKGLDAFHKEYSSPPLFVLLMMESANSISAKPRKTKADKDFLNAFEDARNAAAGSDLWKESNINWAKVAAKWGGVEIAPFQSKRDNVFWYSTWDCASGVVWDLDAISIKPYAKYDGRKRKIVLI
jgi:hypothetical protein